MGNWTNWTGAGDTIAAGPGWAGLGWVSGTAATESREKNAMNSYSKTPPRPALQSAALTHFQQETSHGCSLNTAGDVTSPGSGSGDVGMQGQGWCGPCYTMQSQDTLKVVNLHCCCWTRWRGGAVWSLLSRPAFILQTAGLGVLAHSY